MIDKDAIQFEKHWRSKIAEEIKVLIDNNSQVNAYGVYLFVRDGANNAGA